MKEGDVGPSVDSDDREERIAARRMRIEQRKEAQKRAAMGTDVMELENVKEEMSISRKQMEDSFVRLKKLHEDGFEMVTNVRVAGDAREGSRRVEEDEGQRQRKEKTEAEAKAGAERFDDITKKWEIALQKELAQDLHEMLVMQKTACDAMLDEKNKLINDCQAELKAKDDQYVKGLKKQAEDIDLLIERMDNQVKELTKAYRTELEQIESSFVQERATMLIEMDAKWHKMMLDRRQKEVDYMKKREEQVEDYDTQIHQLRVQDAEDYNQIKVKLETDVQLLQQQLQQMKATYQLNQEKLEYNFQVLRKRDDENTITKSLQKRKITRLHDVLMNYKRKLAKQEKQFLGEGSQMVDDFKRVTDQYRSLVKKSKHFMDMDTQRFKDIWEMNEAECKEHAQKLLDIDNIIYSQQLGLPWAPPDTNFMNNVGPLEISKTSSDKSAQEVVIRAMQSTGSGPGELEAPSEHTASFYRDYYVKSHDKFGKLKEEDRVSEPPSEHSSSYYQDFYLSKTDLEVVEEPAEEHFSLELIKQILELLCDESGFLLESKVRTLLEPLNRCEQTLMKLDSIFNVMHIESEEDVRKLARYFMKHRNPDSVREELKHDATKKSGPHSTDDKDDIDNENEQEKIEKITDFDNDITMKASMKWQESESEIGSIPVVSNLSLEEKKSSVENVDPNTVINPFGPHDSEIMPVVSMKSVETGISESCASSRDEDEPPKSEDLIHPNDVLRVLKAFVEDSKKQLGKDKIIDQLEIHVDARNSEHDGEYFGLYPKVITPDKLKIWNAMIENFTKYYMALSSRSQLLDERDVLRRQNTELRMLLEQYVNAKVNQELQVPPTKLMQLGRM